MSAPFPFDFGGFFTKPNQTAEQKACGHILSSQMKDGKFFCPSCRLVSDFPLVKPRGTA